MRTLALLSSSLLVLAALASPRLARAEARLEDPVPPDAIRTILPIRRTVLPMRQTILPIRATIVSTEVLEDGRTATEVHLSMGADVLFDFNQAVLKPDAAPAIAKVVDAMNGINGGHVSVSVEGHTDSVGADDYNRTLSVRRAEAVRTALAKRAGSAATFSVDGAGSAKPIAPNKKPDGTDDPQGRARNRRVEIVVKSAG